MNHAARGKQSVGENHLATLAVIALATAAAAGAIVARAVPAGADCDPGFRGREDLGLLESPALTEASGIAASRRNPGVFWVHNDSGDLNRVFAVNGHGAHLGIYTIAGATHRDWEDIATGPGPEAGTSYLYLGDIGDNGAIYATKYVYRLPEPPADSAGVPRDTTVDGAERIAFQYPDGRRDAETLMVDPLTRDIYVVSKRESAVRVYHAPYPQAVGPVITLEHVATLAMTSVVGGDISPSGREILMKSYDRVYDWCREEGETVAAALARPPAELPYTAEPQGEAIAWGADGRDYYTTSEEVSGVDAHLYVYHRDRPSAVDTAIASRDGAPDAMRSAPNPFRTSTTLRYRLPRAGRVAMTIASPRGRVLRVLVAARQDAGNHAVFWDGCDQTGSPLPAGVYFCVLRSEAEIRACPVIRLP